jgi:HK97 family phage prohead protease
MVLITRDRHYKTFEFEHRQEDDGRMMVYGRAVVFDQETVIYEIDGVQYKEKVDLRAFDEAKMDDVVLVVDHTGKPAAKTRNGTLKLFVRPDGLYIEADLSKNATGRELFEDIKNGFFDRMSFSFTVAEDEYDRDTRTRTIKKIKRLYDVSAVTFPAYEQTSLVARSWAEAQYEIEKKAAEAARAAEAAKEAEASSKNAEALALEKLRAQILSKF